MSSPSLAQFLESTVRGEWGAPAGKINLMAHSLGNLVAYDALRLIAMRNIAPKKTIRDYLGVEPAVWGSAFEDKVDLVYPSSLGSTSVTYNINEQMQHTWRFWFNQKGAGTLKTATMTGKVQHSYHSQDYALDAMIGNDYLMRGTALVRYHYARNLVVLNAWPLSALQQTYRGAIIGETYRPSQPNAARHKVVGLAKVPGLLKQGQHTPGYSLFAIEEPVGQVTNPIASVNHHASSYGWVDTHHGDHAGNGDQIPTFVPVYIANIWPWFERVFVGTQFVEIGKDQ